METGESTNCNMLQEVSIVLIPCFIKSNGVKVLMESTDNGNDDGLLYAGSKVAECVGQQGSKS